MKTLRAFLPSYLLQYSDIVTEDQPSLREQPGIVVLVDISGYTQLTNKFQSQGRSGTEKLTQILQKFFGDIVSLIKSYEGDVIKFAGDSVTFCFRGAVETDHLEEGLVLRAIKCVLSVMECAQKNQMELKGDNIHLSVHMAVAGGTVENFVMGERNMNRRDYIILGSAIKTASDLLTLSSENEIAIVDNLWEFVRDQSWAKDQVKEAKAIHDYYLLTPKPFKLAVNFTDTSANNTVGIVKLLQRASASEATDIYKQFLHETVLHTITTNDTQLSHEIRSLTVLFIHIKNCGFDRPKDYDNARQIFSSCQQRLQKYEGMLRQWMFDDKGLTAVATFGLPPLAHSNDCLFAVQAALEISSNLSSHRVEFGIGVCTGFCYSGIIGTSRRCDHTILGQSVNSAARLACSVECANSVFVDMETWALCREFIEFSLVREIDLKGTKGKFRYVVAERLKEVDNFFGHFRRKSHVGRDNDITRFKTIINDHILESKLKSVLIVEGQSGFGKSFLLFKYSDLASQNKFFASFSVCSEIDRLTPMAALKPLIKQLVEMLSKDLTGEPSKEDRLFHVLRKCSINQDLDQIFNYFLGNKFSMSEKANNISLSAFTEAIGTIMKQFIAKVTEKNPIALFFDDLQWIDSSSINVITYLIENNSKIIVVMATRPMSELADKTLADVLNGLKSTDFTQSLTLGPFTRLDVEQLLIESFRGSAKKIAQPVLDYLQKETSFHPSYVSYVVDHLRTNQKLTVIDHVLQLDQSVSIDDDSVLQIKGVSTLLRVQFDSLNPLFQEILYAATVLGQQFKIDEVLLTVDSFVIDELEDIETTPQNLISQWDIYQYLEAMGPDGTLRFKYALVYQTIYAQMMNTRRQELHERVFKLLKSKMGSGANTNFNPQLAIHAMEMNNSMSKYEALNDLLQSFLARFLWSEALNICDALISISSFSPNVVKYGINDFEILRYQLYRIICFSRLWMHEDAIKAAEQLLAELGIETPTSKFGLVCGLAKAALLQRKLFLSIRNKGKIARLYPGLNREKAEILANLYYHITEVYVHEGNRLSYVNAVFNGKNWSDVLYLKFGNPGEHFVGNTSVIAFFSLMALKNQQIFNEYLNQYSTFLDQAPKEDILVHDIHYAISMQKRGFSINDCLERGKDICLTCESESMWERDSEMSRIFFNWAVIGSRTEYIKFYLSHMANSYIMGKPINNRHKPIVFSAILSALMYYDLSCHQEIVKHALENARTYSNIFLKTEDPPAVPSRYVYFVCCLYHVKWDKDKTKVMYCLKNIIGLESDTAGGYPATVGMAKLAHALVFHFKLDTEERKLAKYVFKSWMNLYRTTSRIDNVCEILVIIMKVYIVLLDKKRQTGQIDKMLKRASEMAEKESLEIVKMVVRNIRNDLK